MAARNISYFKLAWIWIWVCVCGGGWISRGLMEPKCVSMSLCVSISFLPSQTSAFHIPNDRQTAGCLTILEILCYRPNHVKKLMQSDDAPIPDSQGREADWSSWCPLYTLQLQSSVTKEATAHCTDMDAEAYSCPPEDGDKGGGLRGQEKRSVTVWRHQRCHSTLHSREKRGLMFQNNFQ